MYSGKEVEYIHVLRKEPTSKYAQDRIDKSKHPSVRKGFPEEAQDRRNMLHHGEGYT